MKKCRICNEEKSEDEFYLRKDSGKLRNECKKCVKGDRKEYYIENREEKLEYNKHYAETHKELIYAIDKKRRDEDLEKQSERHRIYYEEHKEERQEYKKNKRKNDEQFRIIECLRTRLRNAFVNFSSNGKLMISKKYGIDFQKIFEYIGPCPGERRDYHIDHIIPLCSFNFDDPEQVKKAFAPENHRWITKEENLKKSSEDKKKKRK